MYHHAALLANIPIDDYYTPAGARWWKEKLTTSEICAVMHALVDTLLASTALPAPSRNYFDMLCALLSVHTVDEESVDRTGLLLATRINECLSSSTYPGTREAICGDIHSWSQSLLRVLSHPETADLRLALSTSNLPFVFILPLLTLGFSTKNSPYSDSLREMELSFCRGYSGGIYIFIRRRTRTGLPDSRR